MATFITNQKGGQKLIYDGFMYTKDRIGAKGQIYWKCDQRGNRLKCPGYATSRGDDVNVTRMHNHGPSPNRIELAQIKSRIKDSASTSNLAPRALVNQKLAGISEQSKVFQFK